MIAVASVRGRWRQLLAAVLAVAVGVGLLGAVLLAAAASRPAVQERLAATSALVVAPPVATSTTPRSHGRIPWSVPAADALAASLAATPGTTAVPDRTFPAVALPGGRPVGDPDDLEGGHGVASLALGGHRVTAGERPRGPAEVLVPRTLGVGPGDRLAVQFADTVRTMVVSGTTDGPGLWVDDAVAARLAPGVRTIGVLGAVPPTPPGATVLTGDDRAAVEPVQDARVRWRSDQLLGALGLLTVVTTVVVVGAALSTAVAGRRRELGLLRAAGALPGRVRRLVLTESALVGVLGVAAGTVLAVVSAAPLRAVLVAADAARPAPVPAVAGPLAAAGAAGVLLAVTGGLAAARRAARAAPLDVVHDTGPGRGPARGRLVGGLLALAAGALLAVRTAAVTGDGRVGLALATGAASVVAAALLAPALVGVLARAGTARPGGRVTVALVRAELGTNPERAGAVVAPVVVAVGFAVLLGGLVATSAAAYPAQRTAQLAGQVTVERDGTPGLPDDVAHALAVPGARIPLPTVLVVGGPAGPTAVDAVGTADPGLVQPGEVVLSSPTAAALGLAGGAILDARFADGSVVPLRVARILPPDEQRGDLVVDRSQVRAHDPAALTRTAFLPAGAVPDPPPAGVTVRDAAAHAAAGYAVDARLTGLLATLLVAVSAGHGALAVAAGVVAATGTRRADLAVLVAAGATRARIVATVAVETGTAATLGIVLGLAVAVPPLAALASGLSTATGTAVAPVPDAGVTALAAGTCLLVAVLAGAVTAARTVRSSSSVPERRRRSGGAAHRY